MTTTDQDETNGTTTDEGENPPPVPSSSSSAVASGAKIPPPDDTRPLVVEPQEKPEPISASAPSTSSTTASSAGTANRIIPHQHYDPISKDHVECHSEPGGGSRAEGEKDSAVAGTSGGGRRMSRQTALGNEDEIISAAAAEDEEVGGQNRAKLVGQEGLVGDISGCEDLAHYQPGTSITRVYKKCASNGSLAVYVGTRTLAVRGDRLEPLKGVLVLDQAQLAQNVSPDFRVWGQITLTFRYGREDEEVLGLRFCNEAILALKQLWPPLDKLEQNGQTIGEGGVENEDELTPLQVVLLDRVRSSITSTESVKSVPFILTGGPVGLGSFPPPPSVLLAPAKPYRGSPIGTIYDLRIYASDRPEERPPRRHLIRLALRAVQKPCIHVPFELSSCIEARPTFLSRGKIKLSCEINKNAVRYGEPVEISVSVQNNSRSSVRKLEVSLVQQVDVCMFTSGKFKNAVGLADDPVTIGPGASFFKRYVLSPRRVPARQWLALEEAFGREAVLAPSTIIENVQGVNVGALPAHMVGNARNVFAIIVSYYVKVFLQVKVVMGSFCLGQCIKVPFVLLPPENAGPDPYPDPLTGLIPFEVPDHELQGRRISNAIASALTSSIAASGECEGNGEFSSIVAGPSSGERSNSVVAHVTTTSECRAAAAAAAAATLLQVGGESKKEEKQDEPQPCCSTQIRDQITMAVRTASFTGGAGGGTGASSSGLTIRETVLCAHSPARVISQTPMTPAQEAQFVLDELSASRLGEQQNKLLEEKGDDSEQQLSMTTYLDDNES